MTTQQQTAILGEYAARFGEAHAEELMAPNYVSDAAFLRALQECLQRGTPMSIEEAAARFGEPFHETAV